MGNECAMLYDALLGWGATALALGALLGAVGLWWLRNTLRA